jgi:hypothetical protein
MVTDLTNRLKESEEKVRRKQDKIDKLKEGSAGKDASKLMVKIELKIKRKEALRGKMLQNSWSRSS